MRIKRKNGLKIAAITIALLLCLALAVGITGAWYQAKRQATGTLSMDQGIIIDYKGFGKTPDEGIWTRENKTTFLLFDETNAQPGQNISVNTAGIRANEKSVNFYARVKLSYKFYNNGTEVTTLPNASDLITTSANFFGTNWVDGGSSDGYYYYATGSTLNKFEKGTQTFVDLFATDAKFVIEGAGFIGANNNGEGGGFKIDETTSINKIEVYLTLETLQGDATAEQAKALGWKIAAPVRFAEATGKMETSVGKTTVTGETLNVSVNNGTSDGINKVVFPYDKDSTLKFDSNNVEYITLTYDKDGVISTETFEETALNTITVKADSSKGKVTGYTVGLFSSEEYTDFTFSYNNYIYSNNVASSYTVPNGNVAVSGYFGSDKIIVIPSKTKVRERDFKVVLNNLAKDIDNGISSFLNLFLRNVMAFNLSKGVKLEWTHDSTSETIATFNSLQDVINFRESGEFMIAHEMDDFSKYSFTLTGKTYCVTSGVFYGEKKVTEIGFGSFRAVSDSSGNGADTIVAPETINKVADYAFSESFWGYYDYGEGAEKVIFFRSSTAPEFVGNPFKHVKELNIVLSHSENESSYKTALQGHTDDGITIYYDEFMAEWDVAFVTNSRFGDDDYEPTSSDLINIPNCLKIYTLSGKTLTDVTSSCYIPPEEGVAESYGRIKIAEPNEYYFEFNGYDNVTFYDVPSDGGFGIRNDIEKLTINGKTVYKLSIFAPVASTLVFKVV